MLIPRFKDKWFRSGTIHELDSNRLLVLCHWHAKYIFICINWFSSKNQQIKPWENLEINSHTSTPLRVTINCSVSVEYAPYILSCSSWSIILLVSGPVSISLFGMFASLSHNNWCIKNQGSARKFFFIQNFKIFPLFRVSQNSEKNWFLAEPWQVPPST